MSFIKTILVPTDFSPTANSAVKYAQNLAGAFGSAIILYHTYIPYTSGFYPQELSQKENAEMEEKLMAQLETIKATLLKESPEIAVSVQLDRGPENVRLIEFCEKNPVDLIVMGTIGASGLKEVVIGSFAADTMIAAPCPVLAIPQGCAFKAPQRITYATQYHPEDMQVLNFLAEWSQKFGATIHLLHIDDTGHAPESEEALFSAYKTRIESRCGALPITFEHLAEENISGAILQVALRDKTDILAVSPIKRESFWEKMFHKSVTKTTAYHISIPLLTVPIK